jgi:hypothetical protein
MRELGSAVGAVLVLILVLVFAYALLGQTH